MFLVHRQKNAHFVTISEYRPDSPFDGVPAFITQITRNHISPWTSTVRSKRAGRISLGEGYCTPITLEHRPSRHKWEWFWASRFAATRIPGARMVKGGGEVRFGWHNDINTFA